MGVMPSGESGPFDQKSAKKPGKMPVFSLLSFLSYKASNGLSRPEKAGLCGMYRKTLFSSGEWRPGAWSQVRDKWPTDSPRGIFRRRKNPGRRVPGRLHSIVGVMCCYLPTVSSFVRNCLWQNLHCLVRTTTPPHGVVRTVRCHVPLHLGHRTPSWFFGGATSAIHSPRSAHEKTSEGLRLPRRREHAP